MQGDTPKSVVIVSDVKDSNYSSGFILVTQANIGTYVVTDGNFVEGRENRLQVCFSDGTELAASLISSGIFTLLRTEFHPLCDEVRFIKGDVTLSRAMMFPPASPRSFYCLPSFVTLESLEAYPCTTTLDLDRNQISYRFRSKDKVDGSDMYFLVDAHYSEKSSSSNDRLAMAPVYTMRGSVMGLVLAHDRHCTVKKIAMSAKSVLGGMNSLRNVALNDKRGADKGCSNAKKSSGNKKRRRGDGSSFK